MALIKNLRRITKDRNSVHGVTDAVYTIFQSEDGAKYFQIDTTGSAGRQIAGKTSQSIQLNRETAESLVAILKAEFSI